MKFQIFRLEFPNKEFIRLSLRARLFEAMGKPAPSQKIAQILMKDYFEKSFLCKFFELRETFYLGYFRRKSFFLGNPITQKIFIGDQKVSRSGRDTFFLRRGSRQSLELTKIVSRRKRSTRDRRRSATRSTRARTMLPDRRINGHLIPGDYPIISFYSQSNLDVRRLSP